ncbi:Protein of unknown function DUF3704 containing protein [Cricetulus griseus]|nr:Protein of unknown function DUF3704 containing protein [Cricetulus griseus]
MIDSDDPYRRPHPPWGAERICDSKNFKYIVDEFRGFQFLAITNSAAMTIIEQMSLLYECASFGYMPKSGIAGSCGRMIPIF